MTGKGYANPIAAYVAKNHQKKGVAVNQEISIGKHNQALAIECNYPQTHGAVDEKIPYALNDIAALRMPGCVAYAGTGFSEGSTCCLPDSAELAARPETREWDHALAVELRWWDVLIGDKRPFALT
ncbi:MAG: PD-(D/E)XK nuclease superfamily protein [Nannocystaceae bacterium]